MTIPLEEDPESLLELLELLDLLALPPCFSTRAGDEEEMFFSSTYTQNKFAFSWLHVSPNEML